MQAKVVHRNWPRDKTVAPNGFDEGNVEWSIVENGSQFGHVHVFRGQSSPQYIVRVGHELNPKAAEYATHQVHMDKGALADAPAH